MDGALIRKRLFELGLTREELAVKIGCSSSTITNALAGRRLGEKNLFQIARVLGVTPEVLIGSSKQSLSKKKPA